MSQIKPVTTHEETFIDDKYSVHNFVKKIETNGLITSKPLCGKTKKSN